MSKDTYRCRDCKHEKARDLFPPLPGNKGGIRTVCTDCLAAKTARTRARQSAASDEKVYTEFKRAYAEWSKKRHLISHKKYGLEHGMRLPDSLHDDSPLI